MIKVVLYLVGEKRTLYMWKHLTFTRKTYALCLDRKRRVESSACVCYFFSCIQLEIAPYVKVSIFVGGILIRFRVNILICIYSVKRA